MKVLTFCHLFPSEVSEKEEKCIIISIRTTGALFNITFEALTLANTKCEECPEVTIEVPNALGNNKLAKSINRALQEEVISKLTFDDEINAETIQEAIESFTNGYFERPPIQSSTLIKSDVIL